MTRVRRGWLLGSLLVGVLALGAQAAGPDPEQVIRYYRKKANLPPAQKVAVANLEFMSVMDTLAWMPLTDTTSSSATPRT